MTCTVRGGRATMYSENSDSLVEGKREREKAPRLVKEARILNVADNNFFFKKARFLAAIYAWTEAVLRFIGFGGTWSGPHETKKPVEFNRRSTVVRPPPLCFHLLEIRGIGCDDEPLGISVVSGGWKPMRQSRNGPGMY
ncbi:hypothetical protein MUK42_18664 [Musa troglodytarum]|uniref:Uncharacterized protein n=1 Tax=Musa troglodytarum TaxID=320322 RepID=A0A9E7JF10_9LILI|nr:hypothetical protein MUK42_18664 [Musa troglodytarum]